MHSTFFLIMRRMRRPLLTLIIAHAIAMIGLVLIPGVDDQGNPWQMSFSHALYVISYTTTTIGYGEVPYPFTPHQRLWMTFCIYLTVITWLYSIGSLITLLQDQALRRVLVESLFRRQVAALREPFVLICGYGETGRALVHTLISRQQRAVVVDNDPERINILKMESISEQVPALQGETRSPEVLIDAGITNPWCRGVVAMTQNNNVNLKVAITAKLLHRDLKVICRADSKEVEANMASFGTDHILDPFDTFALHLATAMQSPCLFQLRNWLTGKIDRDREPVALPAQGRWILCGYGRFGKAVYERLEDELFETVIIEATPEKTGKPENVKFFTGWGTDEQTLRTAGAEEAVGLVAGTDNDNNNLSIVMTAREINPNLYIVFRQNRRDNQTIVDALGADMVMHPSAIIADRIQILLTTPMLEEFFGLGLFQDEQWACTLFSRLVGLLADHEEPLAWEMTIDPDHANAVVDALKQSKPVTLGQLLANPRERAESLPVVALLLIRHSGERVLLPPTNLYLRPEDQLLLFGSTGARARMGWTLHNEHALRYILTGAAPRQGKVWKYLRKHLAG